MGGASREEREVAAAHALRLPWQPPSRQAREKSLVEVKNGTQRTLTPLKRGPLETGSRGVHRRKQLLVDPLHGQDLRAGGKDPGAYPSRALAQVLGQ